jgi:hypothetical protein
MYYLKYYHCSCGAYWVDAWICTCNDRCPICNLEIEPYRCEDSPEDESDPHNSKLGVQPNAS